MDQLFDAVAAVVSLFSPEKVSTIATQIQKVKIEKAAQSLPQMASTPLGASVLGQLANAWQNTVVNPHELALMLLTASHVFSKVLVQQTTELVWTGPITPFVSTRRTEQVLLQVINSAKENLFITSFVAYNISTIVTALNTASARGVNIIMLLEASIEHGGSINIDAIGKMRSLIPNLRLYSWNNKGEGFEEGRVHAKIAVADDQICFITSANLTAYAMEKNMEAGVLINGGNIPKSLVEHLHVLIEMNIVQLV